MTEHDQTLRRVAPRLALAALGFGAFLLLGERGLTARALSKASARVEALHLRVGGPDFADAPGKDAGPWIAEVAVAKASGADLLPLAHRPRTEGLRNAWASRLATWEPRNGPPDCWAVTVFALAMQVIEAADADLAAGRLAATAEHLRALPYVALVLLDGTLYEARAALALCRELDARLAPLEAALPPTGDPDPLADLASALAGLRLVDGLSGALRRAGAFDLALFDAFLADEPRAHFFGLVTGDRTRMSLAAREHWADIGTALAVPEIDQRAAALARLAAAVDASPPSWRMRGLAPDLGDLSQLLRDAERLQASFDALRARVGAGR